MSRQANIERTNGTADFSKNMTIKIQKLHLKILIPKTSFFFTIQFVSDLGKSKGMDQNENHTLSFTPFMDDLVKEAANIFSYSINELGEKEHA